MKGFAQATQSWQPPAPRESAETGWGAALIQVELVTASHMAGLIQRLNGLYQAMLWLSGRFDSMVDA